MAVAFSATATPLPPGLHGPQKLWVEMPRLHLSAAASVITAAAVVARPVRARRRANPRDAKLLVSLAAVAPAEADVAFLSSVLHEMDQLVMLQKSGEAAEKLARSMVRVTAEPGEVIVRQGQTGESMFIIGEGEVLFETTSASGAYGSSGFHSGVSQGFWEILWTTPRQDDRNVFKFLPKSRCIGSIVQGCVRIVDPWRRAAVPNRVPRHPLWRCDTSGEHDSPRDRHREDALYPLASESGNVRPGGVVSHRHT